MAVNPEALAVSAFQDFLRLTLPAKVTAINLTRGAVLKTPLAGPFTIPADAVLTLSTQGPDSEGSAIPLTAGTRTAAQVAADIDATEAGMNDWTSSQDAAGRLVITSRNTPNALVPSVVCVQSDATGANEALGWDAGGETVVTAPLQAPSYRGVCDGFPLVAPDMGMGFWVILGNRTSRPARPGIRHDTYVVTIQTDVWRPFGFGGVPHRSREAIASCVRAVREVVFTDSPGRYLGRDGDIQLADMTEATIFADPMALQEVSGVLFDVARFTLTCRVFQRPD